MGNFSVLIYSLVTVLLSVECTLIETYSDDELTALAQFRPLVSAQLPQKWMHSDAFLIKWLRARNLNVKASRAMLFRALEWRIANGFDTDPAEEFGDWDTRFPFDLSSVDKYGHPVLIAKLGRWNPRQLILAGQADKYSRFLIRTLFELPSRKAVELGTSQFVFVLDLHGFNGRQHICLSCLPSYRNIVRAYEEFYPLASNKTVIINAPAIFETLMSSLRPILNGNRRRDLQVFGYDKMKWSKVLMEFIDEDQLPMQYNGNKLIHII